MLQKLITELRGHGVDVAIARMSSERALATARRTGLIDALGEDHIFRSVEEAVRNRPA
jgi:MFS superfamily sulfate permease-like transporter